MSPLEPQSAADYDDRSTEAVRSVLLEIGQILGSYHGKFVVVGGLIPWLLQNDEDMPHVGTLDIDLGLDPLALADGEYASLIELLQGQGYRNELISGNSSWCASCHKNMAQRRLKSLSTS